MTTFMFSNAANVTINHTHNDPGEYDDSDSQPSPIRLAYTPWDDLPTFMHLLDGVRPEMAPLELWWSIRDPYAPLTYAAPENRPWVGADAPECLDSVAGSMPHRHLLEHFAAARRGWIASSAGREYMAGRHADVCDFIGLSDYEPELMITHDAHLRSSGTVHLSAAIDANKDPNAASVVFEAALPLDAVNLFETIETWTDLVTAEFDRLRYRR